MIDNPEQQFALAKMRSMREAGATLRAIGDAVGLKAMSVKRILDRAPD